MQKTPLETLGFKTSFVADKSFRLNPAKAGNWRISITAAATLPVEEICCSTVGDRLPV
jgi:hypothetical protein